MLTQFQRVRFNIVLLQLHPFVLLFDPSVWCPLDVVAATTSSTTRGFPLDLLQDPRCQLAACTKSAGSQKDPGCCAISTDAGCLTDYEYRSGFSSCGFGDVSASFRSTCCIWKDDPRKNGTDWSWTPPPVVTKENDPMPLAPNQTGVPDEVGSGGVLGGIWRFLVLSPSRTWRDTTRPHSSILFPDRWYRFIHS